MLKLNSREIIAKRIAQELKEGDVVNLGVGIPTLVASFLEDKTVYFQSENGLIGMGPPPASEELDIDLIDAGKNPTTLAKGAALFHSADSFAMIRGGHVDAAILGTLQVDRHGEIANWAVPNQPILGVGGAMDLVVGAKKLIVAATLFTKNDSPKLVEKLTYKSTGERKADLFVTEYAAFTFSEEGIKVIDLYGDLTIDELSEKLSLPLVSEIQTIK
ncbi:MAG TPA: 3-oxoacid CoA-transferase subunit B [Rummeliibacillus sp.]|nr:3-oxoacid CoA-transferase subunit B [Rummeliibacillus sp.]